MKKITKVISICLISIVTIVGAIAGLLIFDRKNKSENNIPVEETYKYPFVYYASAAEAAEAESVEMAKKGGSIYLSAGSEMVMANGIIENHEAVCGGAIYIEKGATFTMTGGTIGYNYAYQGGAIYVESGATCNITGGNILYNKAEVAPAIFAAPGAKINVDNVNTVIKDNDYIDFGNCVVNFYVDGVFDKLVVQNVPVLNYDFMPLTYNECNGYFLDEDMTIAVERGESYADALGELTDQKEWNIYTRTATPNAFTYEYNATYNTCLATLKSGISGEIVAPKTYVINSVERNITAIDGLEGKTLTEMYIPAIKGYLPSVKNCGYLKTMNIPNTISIIGDNCFYSCGSLESIVIPSSVVSIGNYAFRNSFKYGATADEQRFVMGENVKTLGTHVFVGSNLKSVVLPDSIQTIGERLFNNSEIESVTIGSGITVLKTYMFASCLNLKSVVIPDNVKTIEYAAFNHCDNLESVDFGLGLETIGDVAFKYCAKLSAVEFKEGSNLKEIGTGAFNACPLTTLVLNDGLETIKDQAFMSCSNVNEVVLPSTVTTVGVNAFAHMLNLKITLNTINAAAVSAVTGTNTLFSVIIGNNVTEIPANTFATCVRIVSVTIPSSVNRIYGYAFDRCNALAEVILADGDLQIDSDAFVSCAAIASLEIGRGAKTVAYDAFPIRNSLTTVKIASLEDWCKLVDWHYTSSPFEYATSIYFNGELVSDTLVIPDSITEISSRYAFAYTNFENVVVPSSVKTIGVRSFAFSSITNITLNEGLNTIRQSAFSGVKELKTIALPNSVTSLGTYVFSQSSIQTVTFGTSLTSIPAYAFYYSNVNNLTIPSNIKSIEANAFSYCFKLTQISLRAGIEAIGNSVFEGSSLTSVVLPSTITMLGTAVFKNAKSLVSANLEGVAISQLPSETFSGCPLLTNVTLYSEMYEISSKAFYNCTGLVTNPTPQMCFTYGESSFEGCVNLTSVGSDYLNQVGNRAFYGCESLASVGFNQLFYSTSIGDYAFYGCVELQTIFSSTDLSVGAYAFVNSGLKNIGCGDCAGLSHVGAYAFKDTAITDVVIVGTNDIEDNAFSGANITQLTCLSFDGDFNKNYLTKKGLTMVERLTTVDIKNFGLFQNYASLKYLEVTNSTLYRVTGAYPEQANDVVISNKAFYNTNLVNVVINGHNISIGEQAFASCASLKTFTTNHTGLQNRAEYAVIWDYAFSGSAIERVSLWGIQEIGAYAFNGATKLTTVDFFGESVLIEGSADTVRIIRQYAFAGCTSLTTLTNFPHSLQTIMPYAFSRSGLISVVIPNSVTSFGDPFEKSNGQIVKGNVFTNCADFESIEFEEGCQIQTLYSNTFYQCYKLEEITIPASVTTLGANAFNVSGLTSVVVPETVLYMEQSVFANCPNLVTATFSADSYAQYEKTAFNEYDLKGISYGTFYNCTALERVDITSSELKIIGNRAFSYCAKLKTINIPASVYLLDERSFNKCAFEKMEILKNASDLPEFENRENSIYFISGSSLQVIGKRAFYLNTCLTEIVIPVGVTDIGAEAFYDCVNVEVIYIPNTVTTIVADTASGYADDVHEDANELENGSPFFRWPLEGESTVLSVDIRLQGDIQTSWGLYWNSIYVNESAYVVANYTDDFFEWL